jgi:hypothetical protein
MPCLTYEGKKPRASLDTATLVYGVQSDSNTGIGFQTFELFAHMYQFEFYALDF